MELDYESMTSAQQAQFREALKTNPEFLASLETGGAAPDSAYETEGQKTGTWDNGEKVTIFDSNTGQYQTIDVDPNDPFAFKNDNPDIGYFQNQEGDYVYGVKPTQTYTVGGVDDTSSYEGVNPNWTPTVIPDLNGIGGDRQVDGSVGPNIGGQRTPDNTNIGGGVDAGDPFGWQGSPSNDIEGNIVPGGTADPNSRPTYERSGVPWTPSDPFSGVVNGGVQGVGTAAPQATASRDNPLQGYESSSNKDYYQKQFQNMRAQQLGQQDAGNAAAAYQAPAQSALADPWANSNLPEVVVGGANDDPNWDPNEWGLTNPDWAGQTNQQILTDMGTIFNDSEQAMLGEAAKSNDWNTSQYWGGTDRDALYNTMLGSGGSGQSSPEWMGVKQKIYNNLFTQQGDQPTPGGMNVPTGYASPTNA
jgi:hypothetical protein